MNQSAGFAGLDHNFGTLPVSAPIARSLKAMQYEIPTPVQERAIPLLRDGQDVLAQAQTGTGKTAGFGIPLIESIRTQEQRVQAIVLVPTRELCLQVADELERLGNHSGIRVLAVYGGVGLGRQMEILRRGVHVVVGTPGRVEDLLQRGSLNLSHVRYAVLDEADRMLDVGFLPVIERILKQTPSARQTALFSATIPAEVVDLAHRQMRRPTTVQVDPDRPTVDTIEQRFERVQDGDKLSALTAYLDRPGTYLALVFRRTTYKVDRLVRDLSKRGYKVAALHGRRTQHQRERVLADLKSGKLQAVVATDIAARGLDISGLTHVFNYDLPDTPETYVHRIGRTGRAGETGTAVTFIAEEDEQLLKALQRFLDGRRADTSAGAPPHSRASKPDAGTHKSQAHSRPNGGGAGNARPRRNPVPGRTESPRNTDGGKSGYSRTGHRSRPGGDGEIRTESPTKRWQRSNRSTWNS